MLEHGFGTQEAGSQRDRDDVFSSEFAGHGEGQAYDGNFDEIIKEIAAIVESVAVRDFENDCGASTWLAST